jgi:uncharacterized protein (TIGR02391 family)
MDTLNDLKQFYSELKTYKDTLEHLAKSTMILGHEIRERDELREKLVRRSGRLKPIIIKLTKKQYISRARITWDMWDMGLDPYPSLPENEISLAHCIDATNEAIGKLTDDIAKGIRDKEGNLTAKGKISKTEMPADTAEVPVYLFDKMQFHPKVIEASRSCFTTINYREAILNAFISLIDYIKEISGLDLDGDDLMNNVFSFNYDNEQRKITKYPLIRINELKNKTDRDEQQGFMFLCKGAAAFVRNPKAHKLIVLTDPLHTLEYLAFASMLFKQLDKRVQIRHMEHSS